MSLNIPEDNLRVSSEASALKKLYKEYREGGQNYDLVMKIAGMHAQVKAKLQKDYEQQRHYELKDMAAEGDRLEDKRRNRKMRQNVQKNY